MNAKIAVFAGLVAVSLMPAGCLLVPRHGGGVAVVAPLPAVVVLGSEPYYSHSGYRYHYRDDGWYYSRSKRGPWTPLPRDHYPREVRYKGRGPDQDGRGNHGGHGR